MLLSNYGIHVQDVVRNAPPARLYEEAISFEPGAAIASSGALMLESGTKTGRSPKDKRLVRNPASENDIWWGTVNMAIDDHTFMINRERAIDYLNTLDRIYVVDGFAGWDPNTRIKARIICTRPYHALFMWNMLIRPTEEELASYGEPDYVVFNAGRFPANKNTSYMTSKTSVDLSFERGELVILGTGRNVIKGIWSFKIPISPSYDGIVTSSASNVRIDSSGVIISTENLSDIIYYL